MEDVNMILDEVETVKETLPKKSKNSFKEKECEVILYDEKLKTLDVLFDKYGIRIFDVAKFDGKTVKVKYKGEIGSSDFMCKL